MRLCPFLGRNGKIKTYKGFEVYQYVSEHKSPRKVIEYKAYMPWKGLVTKPHRKLSLVKIEIDHIVNDHMVCEPLRRALPRTKKNGGRRCARMIR